MVGRTVGKYRILDRIGRGGMGTVYLAEDETLDRQVAIKVLNPDVGETDVLKRFRAEAVTLARLSHPGIATIYELHRQQDDLLMVMEYVRGETLHDLSERVGPLEPPQAAHLCIQALDALGYAHRAGVIHRDLKPANLMVTESGAVKVMDFGIARVLGTEHFTMNGMMMGTPAYMAPEQVSGESIDGRADLYAVGVVFYRLLTGRLPFVADTAMAMVQKQVTEEPTPIATVRPDLPVWCTAVVRRALAKNPNDRFQTAEEFRQTLSSVVVPQSLGELPTLATPTSGITVSPGTLVRMDAGAPNAEAPPTHEHTTTVVLGPTHLLAVAALVLVLCAGIVLLAFAAFRSRSAPVFEMAAAAPVGETVAQSESAPEPKPEPEARPESPPVPPVEPAAQVAASARTVEPSVRQATTGTPSEGAAGTAGARPSPAVRAAAPDPALVSASKPEPEPVPESPDPSESPAPASSVTTLPSVAFGNVRVVTTDGETARETRGMLRVGNGTLAMGNSPEAARVLSSLGDVQAIFYSRSRQPRWRDASGQEVASRVDLGRMGFLRGDRNWLILLTGGDPVILSVEDSQLRQVSQAIEARTGRIVQRFP